MGCEGSRSFRKSHAQVIRRSLKALLRNRCLEQETCALVVFLVLSAGQDMDQHTSPKDPPPKKQNRHPENAAFNHLPSFLHQFGGAMSSQVGV